MKEGQGRRREVFVKGERGKKGGVMKRAAGKEEEGENQEEMALRI